MLDTKIHPFDDIVVPPDTKHFFGCHITLTADMIAKAVAASVDCDTSVLACIQLPDRVITVAWDGTVTTTMREVQ